MERRGWGACGNDGIYRIQGSLLFSVVFFAVRVGVGLAVDAFEFFEGGVGV